MSNKKVEPFISAEQNIPEITIKAILISILLVVVLCASNAYLGLKLGNTVAASIPAAIIGMGILRLFKNATVLENNIIQTCASVSESVVAGVAFVLPALIILHYWQGFHYWQTLLLCLFGGILGMLFSIPIRRVMLDNPTLRFPEGTAIAMVVKSSVGQNTDMKPLIQGSAIGAIISLFQGGFRIISDQWPLFFIKSGAVWGLTLGFSPALIAAGYIIGIQVSISIIVGLIINVCFAFPHLSAAYISLTHSTDLNQITSDVWSQSIRYMGVGTMLIGGLWTIITLVKPIFDSLRTSFAAFKKAKLEQTVTIRTERDIPLVYALILIGIVSVLAFIMFYYITSPQFLADKMSLHIGLTFTAILFILIGGFLFASISAYFAGLVGSTNNPGSGLIVACMLLLSLIFTIILTLTGHTEQLKSMEMAALIIMISTVVGCMLTISNDSMQDFKAGQLVGATPWKQQVILLLGIVIASLVVAPILQLLYNAYGLGGVFPRPNMPVSQMLPAPQAGIMAAIVTGVFDGGIPWHLVGAGAAIGFGAILVDEFAKRNGFRFPVLAVGLGIYLPSIITVAIVTGGILSYIVKLVLLKRVGHRHFSQDPVARHRLHRGIILCCGLVSGSSIMGVLLAIPFAIFKNDMILNLMPSSLKEVAYVLGFISTALMVVWIYRSILIAKSNHQ